MQVEKLERDFEIEMYRIYKEAFDKCKYRAQIFHNMLQEYGGLVTAKKLLSQHGLQHGFEKLAQSGYPYITMESLVLRDPWRHLFTTKEKEIAVTRLKTFKYAFDHGECLDEIADSK